MNSFGILLAFLGEQNATLAINSFLIKIPKLPLNHFHIWIEKLDNKSLPNLFKIYNLPSSGFLEPFLQLNKRSLIFSPWQIKARFFTKHFVPSNFFFVSFLQCLEYCEADCIMRSFLICCFSNFGNEEGKNSA